MENCTEIESLMNSNLDMFKSLWNKHRDSTYSMMVDKWIVFYNTTDDSDSCE